MMSFVFARCWPSQYRPPGVETISGGGGREGQLGAGKHEGLPEGCRGNACQQQVPLLYAASSSGKKTACTCFGSISMNNLV